jgi:hypothetical protein
MIEKIKGKPVHLSHYIFSQFRPSPSVILASHAPMMLSNFPEKLHLQAS